MSKVKRWKIIGVGGDCPKCNLPMDRRTHKEILERQLRGEHYFSEWDFCAPCGHVQHYEKYKVFNETQSH